MKTEKIMHIEGMTCAHCKAAVEKALGALQGVSAEVNLGEKAARIRLSNPVTDEVLKKAVTDAGYEVISITEA